MRKWPVLLLVLVSAALGQTPSVRSSDGVLNSASYATEGQPGFGVSPGYLISIFGTELAERLTVAGSIPLSTSIDNISVSFNDKPAPLLFVSPGQINAQLPWDAIPADQASGTATVVVTRGANRSEPRQVQLARFSPGIYTLTSDGVGQAVAVNAADGSVTQPAGAVPGVNTRPGRRGEAIILYVSGLGPVDPPAIPGAASLDTLRRTTTLPAVLIGGVEAPLIFSGLAPEFPAVNQVNVTIPDGAPAGDRVPIQVRIGGITSTNQVTIAVQN